MFRCVDAWRRLKIGVLRDQGEMELARNSPATGDAVPCVVELGEPTGFLWMRYSVLQLAVNGKRIGESGA